MRLSTGTIFSISAIFFADQLNKVIDGNRCPAPYFMMKRLQQIAASAIKA
jgi:hypothetical protein